MFQSDLMLKSLGSVLTCVCSRLSRWWWGIGTSRCWSCRDTARVSSGRWTFTPKSLWQSPAATTAPSGQHRNNNLTSLHINVLGGSQYNHRLQQVDCTRSTGGIALFVSVPVIDNDRGSWFLLCFCSSPASARCFLSAAGGSSETNYILYNEINTHSQLHTGENGNNSSKDKKRCWHGCCRRTSCRSCSWLVPSFSFSYIFYLIDPLSRSSGFLFSRFQNDISLLDLL